MARLLPPALAIACIVALASWLVHGRTAPRALPPIVPMDTPSGEHQPSDPQHAEARASLEVLVRSPSGRPLEGKLVSVTRTDADTQVDSRRTNHDGVSDFGRRREAQLMVWIHPETNLRLPVGQFRRREGDTRLEFVLHEPRTLIVRVSVEGKPELPRDCWVSRPRLRQAERDPDSSTIRGRFYPTGSQVDVFLAAPGFVQEGSREGFPEGASAKVECAGDPVHVDLNLTRSVQLRIRFVGPIEMAGRVLIQRFSAAEGWEELAGNVTLAEDGSVWTVPPGRFRTVLERTRAILSEFEIGDDNYTHVVDLNRLEWLRIHVELPEGVPMSRTRLKCDAPRLAQTEPVIWWARNPHPRQPFFALVIPVDRAFRFVPAHSLCAPDPDQDPPWIHGGGEHVFRMVSLPLVRFSLDETPLSGSGGDAPRPRHPANIRVRLFDRGVLDRPAYEADAIRTPQGYALAGWVPGTYTIQFRIPGSLPVLRSQVELPAHGLDLGPIPRRPGATLRVLAAGPGRASLRRIQLTSESLPSITYTSVSRSLVARGLPAGRYLLRCTFSDTTSDKSAVASTERRITVDDGQHQTVHVERP